MSLFPLSIPPACFDMQGVASSCSVSKVFQALPYWLLTKCCPDPQNLTCLLRTTEDAPM